MALTQAEKRKIEEEEKYRSEIKNKFSKQMEMRTNRSKSTAAVLAILFGGIGIHKFYLGKPGWGLLYIFFSWTFIPMVVGVIEGIIYLSMSDRAFETRYS